MAFGELAKKMAMRSALAIYGAEHTIFFTEAPEVPVVFTGVFRDKGILVQTTSDVGGLAVQAYQPAMFCSRSWFQSHNIRLPDVGDKIKTDDGKRWEIVAKVPDNTEKIKLQLMEEGANGYA